MTLDFEYESPILVRDIIMPIVPAPLPYRFQGPGQTIFCRLAFDNPVPFQGLTPIMGETQQIETESRVPTPSRAATRR